MLMLRLVRWVRGTVSFSVCGGYIERFINLCAKEHVPIWNTTRVRGTFSAQTTLSASKKLKKIASKAGLALTINKSTGIPILIRKYRSRKGVFIGIVLALLIPVVLSNFVLNIRVVGNEIVPTHIILDRLAELGVHMGAWRGNIDARNVERQIIISDDNITWVAVNLRGANAEIIVRERADPITPRDTTTPHNIIATHDGFITSMEVFEGQKIVGVGDSVLKGELLVSGLMQDVNLKARTVYARAKIMAQIEDTVEIQVPYEQITYEYTGYESKKTLNIYSLSIPLGGTVPDGDYKYESATMPLYLIGNILPINITTEHFFLREEKREVIDEEKAMEIGMDKLYRYEEKFFLPDSVISRDINGVDIGECFLVYCDYFRSEDIAYEIEILTSNFSDLM